MVLPCPPPAGRIPGLLPVPVNPERTGALNGVFPTFLKHKFWHFMFHRLILASWITYLAEIITKVFK